MSKRILYYDIIENTLSKDKSFRGVIHHTLSLNNQAIVNEIVSRNTTVSRQEALAVIDIYEQVIKENLAKGNTITTGLFRADISMTGKFDSMIDKIDYKKHKARVVIRPAIKLNKQVCGDLRFHKRREPRNNTFISYIMEMGKKLPHDSISAGGVFYIKGKGLKYHRHENNYELTLSNDTRASYPLRVLTATFGKITCAVPADVPPGEYWFNLVHSYGSVNRQFPSFKIAVVKE